MPLDTLVAKLKVIYRAQNTLPKLIEDPSIPSQRMDEYYVALQMIMDNAGEKRDIQVGEMFNAIDRQPKPNKVLIIGGAGAGKTTFLHHISYEWGNANIYQNNFDFVFKVKLKKLSSEGVRSMLEGLSKVDRLVHLVKSSLEDQKGELDIKFRKMSAPGEKIAFLTQLGITEEQYKTLLKEEFEFTEIKSALGDRTLLLLDGYDEIAHLDRSSSSVVYHVMQTILDYQVMMTSRPNALSSDRESQFDRRIESNGLDQNSAQEYIERFFTKQRNMLLAEVDNFFSSIGEIEPGEIEMKIDTYLKKDAKKSTLAAKLEVIFQDSDSTPTRSTRKVIVRDKEMVRSSIVQYFHKIQNSLTEMFLSNADLREVFSTPINAALLCLVSSDPEFRNKLQRGLNAGTLYQEALVWLGKRYMHNHSRYARTKLKDVTIERVFNIPELRVLKDVAYGEFSLGRVIISGKLIQEASKEIDNGIREVNEFGLLRPESTVRDEEDNEADELIERDHSFIHLSFQEFLSAHMLKEQLMSDREINSVSNGISLMIPEYQNAAEFIGMHRNEPRYLMTLKFLAGLVANERGENSEILVNRFWEVIICNIDGLLEFGLNSKVTLFMHLLSQAKINGVLDDRIPQLNRLVQLIDIVVICDLTSFTEELIASGYMSQRISEAILANLNLNYRWKIEYATSLVEQRHDFAQVAQNILDHSKVITTSKEQKIKTLSLRRIELQTAIRLSLKLMLNGQLTSQVFLNAIFNILNHPDWQVKKVAINALESLIKNKLTQSVLTLSVAKEVFKILQWHITDDNLKPEVFRLLASIREVLSMSDLKEFEVEAIKIIVQQMEIFYKSKKAEEIQNILPLAPHSECIDQEMLDGLIEQSNNTNWLQKYLSLSLILKIFSEKQHLITENLMDTLLVNANDVDDDAKKIKEQILTAIVIYRPDLRLLEKLVENINNASFSVLYIKVMTGLLTQRSDLIHIESLSVKLSDENGNVRRAVAEIFSALALQKPDLISNSIIDSLFAQLNDESCVLPITTALSTLAMYRSSLIDISMLMSQLNNESSNVRKFVVETLNIIARQSPDLITCDIAESLSKKLSDTDIYVQQAVAITLSVIATHCLNLINRYIIDRLRERLREGLSGLYDSALPFVVSVFDAIAIRNPSLLDSHIMDSLVAILNNEYVQNDARQSIAITFGTIAVHQPNVITSVTVNSLMAKLNDTHGNVRQAVGMALALIVVQRPDLITISSITAKFSDEDVNVRHTVAIALGTIVVQKPDLVSIDNLIVELNNVNWNARQIAAQALSAVAAQKPALINNDIVNILTSKLSDEVWVVRQAVAIALSAIATQNPDLINSATANSLIAQLNDPDINVRQTVVNVLDIIATQSPDLINRDIVDTVIVRLNNKYLLGPGAGIILSAVATQSPNLINTDSLIAKLSDEYIEDDVTRILGIIVTQNPALINIDSLITQLNGENFELSQAESIALSTIATNRPDLINSHIVNRLSDDVSTDVNTLVMIATQRHGDLINKPIVDSLFFKLNAENIQNIAAALAVLVTQRPDLINLGSLYAKVADENPNVRQAVAIAFGTIATHNPELISIDGLIVELNNAYWNIKQAAVIALSTVATQRPDLINSSIVNHLSAKLMDEHAYVRQAVVAGLDVIAARCPTLLNRSIVGSLNAQLNDTAYGVTKAVATVLGAIAMQRSDLIDSDIVRSLSDKLSEADYDVKRAVAIAMALAEVAIQKPDLIAMNDLIARLTDEDVNVRQAVATACGAIAAQRPSLINSDIVNLLNAQFSDESSEVREVAANAFGVIATQRPELIPMDNVSAKLSDEDDNVRQAGVVMLGAIANRSPDLINSDIVRSLSDQLDDEATKYDVANILSIIATHKPELIDSDIIRSLSDQLDDETIRDEVANILSIIATYKPDLINHHIVVKLSEILKLSDDEGSQYLVIALSVIATHKPDLIDSEITELLITRLLGAQTFDVMSAVNKILLHIISSFSSVALKFLDHPSKAVRGFVFQVFMAVLSNKLEAAKIRVEALLSIISFYDPKDKEKKHLIELAKKVLNQKFTALDSKDSKYDQEIRDITENHEKLMTLSSETPLFFKKVYVKVLKGNRITLIEKEFIIEMIKGGMAASFTQNDQIIFEGITCTLEDEESKFHLREIIQVALEKKHDLLVEHYNRYQPIFMNYKTGMRRAAANDVVGAASVVDRTLLEHHSWNLSFMHLSDHKKRKPSHVLILLERRNEFGYYEAYKFTTPAFGIDEVIDDQRVSFIIYPNTVGLEERKAIFGEMRYDLILGFKPRYYTTTIRLKLGQGLELLQSMKTTGVTLHDAIIGIAEAVEVLSLDWPQYVEQVNPQEAYKKVKLLALSEQSDDLSARDSVIIEHTESISVLNEFKQKLIDKIDFDLLETILNEEQVNVQKRDILKSLDPFQKSFYRALVIQLNAMYVATSSISSQVIDPNDSTQATTGRIGSFLQSISSHIPLVGLGVQMVGAIMVQVDQNDQADSMERYATIVTNSVDMARLANEIAIHLAPYAKALVIPEEDFSGRLGQAMDMLSKAVSSSEAATQVVTALRGLNPTNIVNSFDFVGIAASGISGLRKRIQDVNEATKQDASAGVSGAKKYAELLISGVEQSAEDAEIADGQEKANDIAAFIIKQIFTGKISAENNPLDITFLIQNIINAISHQFGIDGTITYSISTPGVESIAPSMTKSSAKTADDSDNTAIDADVSKVRRKKAASAASGEDSAVECAYFRNRFLASETHKVLTKKGSSSTSKDMTEKDFKSRAFDFHVSVDIIKTLADFYFGVKKHNIDRGEKISSFFSFGKLNLRKELTAGTSSISEPVTGKTILIVLKKCKGTLVESKKEANLYEVVVVNISWLNSLFETEQCSRPEVELAHQQETFDVVSSEILPAPLQRKIHALFGRGYRFSTVTRGNELTIQAVSPCSSSVDADDGLLNGAEMKFEKVISKHPEQLGVENQGNHRWLVRSSNPAFIVQMSQELRSIATKYHENEAETKNDACMIS